MRVPAIILFYFLFSYAFNYLKSNFQCQSKLLGHRCRHTTGTEEFGVLPIQFRVCIKQGKVRTLYFQSDTTDRGRLQPFFRKIIRKRNLFQADESTTGNACSRIVIRIVGNTQVRILIAFKRNWPFTGMSVTFSSPGNTQRFLKSFGVASKSLYDERNIGSKRTLLPPE